MDMRVFLVAGLACAAAVQLSAQCTPPSGTWCVRGQVNGDPPGRGDAIVYLCYNNTTCTSNPVTSVTTDSNGYFQFDAGPGGTWTVRPQGATYNPATATYVNPQVGQKFGPSFCLQGDSSCSGGGGGCACYNVCEPGCCGYNAGTCCAEYPCEYYFCDCGDDDDDDDAKAPRTEKPATVPSTTASVTATKH
jgi:hypothetical protein